MRKNYTLLLVFVFVLAGFPIVTAQNQAKNTQVVTTCGCPGAAWDFTMPYSPAVTFTVAGPAKRVMFNSYGFNIPATATITGIQAYAIYNMANTANNILRDTLVTLMSPSIAVIEDRSGSTGFINGTAGGLIYGGAGDLWGFNWTPADINSSLFGFSFKLEASAVPADFKFTNGVTLTVYYNLANGISESQKSSPSISAFLSNHKLYIETNSMEELSVDIFALTGQKILSSTIESGLDKSVDISQLTQGVYLYHVRTASGTKVAKFLVD